MNKVILCLAMLVVGVLSGCRDDRTADVGPNVVGNGVIDMAVTGRVGTVVGSDLPEYIKSLQLFLFRQNDNGIYILFKNKSFTKEQLVTLTDNADDPGSGFTAFKEVVFDSLPIGTYQIAGVGNVTDSLGAPLPNAALAGVAIGNTMEQIIARVTADSMAPRLFYGITEELQAGQAQPVTPQLRLYRKVSMFLLTIKDIPEAVTGATVQIGSTSNAFNMTGRFLAGGSATSDYVRLFPTPLVDSVTLTNITLPSIPTGPSTFTLIFQLANGDQKVVPLPSYRLLENTITKLTARINVNSGNWEVDLQTLISVNVEWNVDQEPPVII